MAAVVGAADEPVTLLGQSGGGISSLEAAFRTEDLRKLILYEPPIPVGDTDPDTAEKFAEIGRLLGRSENEQALLLFLSEMAGFPPADLDPLRSAPFWPDMVDAAGLLPRELQAIGAYAFDASRFADVTTPTLLLSGGGSPPVFEAPTKMVHDALPDSRTATFEGERHMAMHSAPDRFVDEVVTFLRKAP